MAAKAVAIVIPRGPTVEQLRDDIDSGRTCDKVVAPDPAAAPLGSDEEAAGTPPSPAAIALARSLEIKSFGPRADADGIGAAWILIGLTMAGSAALCAWALL